MSDDAPRSAQGNRPDQRRGRNAPAWWDQLERHDLPDDPLSYDAAVDIADWPRVEARAQTGRGLLAPARWALVAIVAALAVTLSIWAAADAPGRGSLSVAIAAGLLVAVALGSAVVVIAGRRRG